jgi:antibiotic biosynthesis monooxygenase (ABM) superfamily enzyme
MTATSSSTAPGLGSAGADDALAKPVTLITQCRVLPERTADYTRWQQQISEIVAQAPGYIDGQVIPPSPPSQLDWVIIQRFQTSQQAQAWLRSPERLGQMAIAQPMLVGADDIHIVQGDAKPSEAVSAVISMKIRPGQEQAYRQWAQHIAAAQAQFPGSEGFKLSPPIPGVQEDWATIVQFDNEAHLNAWMTSPERQKLMDEADAFTKESHYSLVRTGFDQWFQFGGAAHAPAWKQNMLVLLGLYPTVFLFGFFVGTPLMTRQLGWPFWLALFVSNIASVTVLNWLVPWISRRFSWWLQPAGSETQQRTLQGIAAVAALYAILLFVFSRFP